MKNGFKKVKWIALLFLCLSDNIYGRDFEGLENREKKESVLELLWKYSDDRNLEIVSARVDERSACENLEGYWKRNLPALSFSTSSSFDVTDGWFGKSKDAAEEEIGVNEVSGKNLSGLFPEELTGVVSVSKEFDCGVGLQVAPSFSLAKKNSDDSENGLSYEKLYLDSVSLDLDLYQRLCLNDDFSKKAASEKSRLYLYKKEAECVRRIRQADCRKKIAELFVSYREACRNLAFVEEYLVYLKEKASGFKELEKKGGISKADVYGLTDEVQDYCEKRNSYKKEMESIKSQLVYEVGFETKDIVFFDSVDFLEDLPDVPVFGRENLEIEYCMIQKNLLQNEYLAEMEDNSPLLKIGMSMPLFTDDSDMIFGFMKKSKKVALNFSLSVDSDFYRRKSLKNDYMERKSLFERKIDSLKVNGRREYEFYCEIYGETLEDCRILEEMLYEKNQILDVMENQFETKKCSYLELKGAELDQKYVSGRLENSRDRLWFFSWMKKSLYLTNLSYLSD